MSITKSVFKKFVGTVAVLTAVTGFGFTVRPMSPMASDMVIVAEAADAYYSDVFKIEEIENLSNVPSDVIQAVKNAIEGNKRVQTYTNYSFLYTKTFDKNFIIIYNPDDIHLLGSSNNPGALQTTNGKQWAQNYSKFLKMLTNLTGISREWQVCILNSEDTFNPNAAGIRTEYDCGSTLGILTSILRNKFTWPTLHETSHTFKSSGCIFDSTDEVFTNYRAVCALHWMGLDSQEIIITNAQKSNIAYRPIDECQKWLPEGSSYNNKYQNAYFKDITIPQKIEDHGSTDNTGYNFFARLRTLFASIIREHVPNPSEEKIIINNWNRLDADAWKQMSILCISNVDNINGFSCSNGVITKKELEDMFKNYCNATNQNSTTEYYNGRNKDGSIKVGYANVTERVSEWLSSYDSNSITLALIYAFNAYDFMGIDIGKETTIKEYLASLMKNVINEQPIDTYAITGTVSFSVSTFGDSSTYQYQWQSYDANNDSWIDIEGSTESSLMVNASKENATKYRCVITKSQTGLIQVSQEASFNYGVPIDKVTLDKDEFEYTGNEIEVDNYLKVYSGNSKLKYGKDFTLKYENNIKWGYKKAKVTVVGINDYFGEFTESFSIFPEKMDPPILSTTTTTDGKTHLLVEWTKLGYAEYNGDFKNDIVYLIEYCENAEFDKDDITVRYVSRMCHPNLSSEILNFTQMGDTCYVRITAAIYDNRLRHVGIPSETRCIKLGTIDNVSLSKIKHVYTGKAINVESYLTVKSGDTELTYGTDYKLTYSNNIQVGYNTASVTITGKGNYSGTEPQTLTYTIYPAKQKKPVLSTLDGGIHVQWKADTSADGYQVQYCQDPSFNGDTKHTATYSKDKTSCNLVTYPKLGETWYVRTRAYIHGATTDSRIGTWSDPECITLREEIDNVSLSKTSHMYTDKAIKVGSYLTVKSGETKLTSGTDYTLTYSNNIKVGYNTASVTITGIGNYTGTQTLTYTIL